MPYGLPLQTEIPAKCVTSVGGITTFILLAALPVAIPLSWVTVVLYRRKVLHNITQPYRARTRPSPLYQPPPHTLPYEITSISGLQTEGPGGCPRIGVVVRESHSRLPILGQAPG